MFSKRDRPFLRSLSFRWSLWYAAIFTMSAAAFMGVFYLMLIHALQTKDREILAARLQEYAGIYDTGGLTALQRWLNRYRDAGTAGDRCYVRLVTRFGRDLILSAPEEWVGFDPGRIDRHGIQLPRYFLRIPQNEEKDFSLASALLADRAILQVGRSVNNREYVLVPLRHTFIGVGLVMMALGFASGGFFIHQAMTPVRAVVAAMKSIIRTGRMEERVPTRNTGDELDDLARMFNHMLDKNQALIQGMRESLDNVAHDLRTPMTRLRGTAEVALQSPDDAEASREALADCVEESDRMLTLLQTLTDIAEAEAGAMRLNVETVELDRLFAEVMDLYEFVAEEKSVRIVRVAPEPLTLRGDPVRLRQVFANLLDNALKYSPDGGRVEIATHREEDSIRIEFRDTGPGIPESEQEKIWQRLYRGDKSRSRKGLGLGLSLVRAIVQAHHGTATVECPAGGGSIFRIRLPDYTAGA